LHAPQVLLLYDPFRRCDQPTIDLIVNLIREQAQAGKGQDTPAAVLILAEASTHLFAACSRIYTISQGQLALQGQALRIVGTIATKDIRQSMRNKLILSILLGTTLLVAGNALLLRALSAHASSPANLVASSLPVLASMISLSLMVLGVALVPLLMLEEKEAHTLETLLVSPARYIQVLADKALAGSVYCLSGGLVILAAYHSLVLHWHLALLGLLLGTAFVVALGLLVGMLSNNPTTLSMWSAVIMFILVIPALLSGMVSLERMPWIEAILTYWPSTAILKLFHLAMVAEIPSGEVTLNASLVAGAAIMLYLVTWWMVRRTDR